MRIDPKKLIGEATEYDKKSSVERKQIKSWLKSVSAFALILLDVYAGKETPYYYVGEGNMTAYIRLGNESVPADNITLKRLVLQGTHRSYDSLVSNYKFSNMAFTKLRSVCKHNTGKDFEDSGYESWGIVDEEENLTNAGALLADESPIRHSRVLWSCKSFAG